MVPDLDLSSVPGVQTLGIERMTVLPDRTLCPGVEVGCASHYIGALQAPVAGHRLHQQDAEKQQVLEQTVKAIQDAWQAGIDRIKQLDETTTLCVAFTEDGPTIVVEDDS